MESTRLHSFLRHRVTWLLWLALLVPIAQSMAGLHGYSHVGTDAANHRDADAAAQSGHCDLCLTAAAVTGGGLLGGESRLALAAGQDHVPQAAPAREWQALPALAYRSRAPPFSAR